MFKFLKKKLKKFEDQLEAELEAELQKEEKKEDKVLEKKIEEEIKREVETRKVIEKKIEKKKRAGVRISEEKLEELLWDLELGLLEADVALSVVESIKKSIREELKELKLDKKDATTIIKGILHDAIANVLNVGRIDFFDYLNKSSKKPFVIMFVGVNGSGKTTAIAKIAYQLKKMGKTPVIAAADTFRAGAIQQLEEHAKRIDVKLIKHDFGADPAAVAYDAIEHAKAKHKDVVLIDTAGRMQTNVNLMDEMAKIKRVAKPDMVIFVGDALSGNDAVEQAKRFDETVGIDGIILTKVDADAKGGSALSIAHTIGKPLLFIGIGQGYDDQIPFDPDWMIKNIFGET
jgi:fused signal recognition particle receptor